MATQETLDIISQNCSDAYCTLREFFKRKLRPDLTNCTDCVGCNGNKNCTLKREASRYEDRILFQFKEIEMLKWFMGEVMHIDIGWDEAGHRWVGEGYALLFHELYDIQGVRDLGYIFEVSKQRTKRNATS
jgi:hypothetical protein